MKYIMLCIALALTGWGNVKSQDDKPKIREAAPNFTLLDLDGNSVSMENYRGSYLVIHFAKTWCPFRNAEAPHLEKLQNDYGSNMCGYWRNST